MSRLTTSPAFVTVICTMCAIISLEGQTIYATEFEEFNVGDDALVGPSFWQFGTSMNTGSHGIDEGLVSGLGKSAFVGFQEPSDSLVTVAVSHSYDPLEAGQPLVEFESILGIEDSSNGHRDTFSVIFLNSTGDLLASIEFRNSNNDFGIWYSDGNKIRNTDVDFIRGELHLLSAQIDFRENTWSAQLDGIDLFEKVTFHDNNKALDLGFTGAQWNLSSPLPSNFGDNFLLIADWFVYAIPTKEVEFSSYSRVLSQDTIHFLGEPGFKYHMEHSSELSTWIGASVPPIQPEEEAEFAFSVDNPEEHGYYRILRYFAPPPTE